MREIFENPRNSLSLQIISFSVLLTALLLVYTERNAEFRVNSVEKAISMKIASLV